MKNIYKLIILTFMALSFGQSNAIDCAECCKNGRATSRECCIQCNGCDMWDDIGAAECKDYPA